MNYRQKSVYIAAALFAVTGMACLLNGFGRARQVGIAGGRYFETEIDILDGIAFLSTAAGLYRFDRRARILAIFLTGVNLIVLAAAFRFEPVVIMWLAVWLVVLFCFVSPSVQAEFAGAHPQ